MFPSPPSARQATLIVAVFAWQAAHVSLSFAVLGPTDAELAAIGVTSLRDRLGADAPTGAGIPVSHVEAGGYVTQDGVTYQYAYTPDTSQGFFAGRNFTYKSGPGVDTNHATNMGANWYGNNGIAPGVTDVDLYSAERFWEGDLLNVGTASLPKVETQRVENHSWIIPAGSASPDFVTDVLRRFDYMLNRDGVIAAVGVNNQSDSLFPMGMANSYNSISIGRSNGNSSPGPSTLDVPGRCKPDLVAPARNTSTATAWLSGAATLLLDTAGNNADAARPQTIKAALLAGATKDEFDLTGATPDTFDDWSHTPDQPLDLRYGAGELNVDNSYRILTAGEAEAGTTPVGSTGWDFDTINAGQSQLYFFDVHPAATIDSLSIAATWNREFAVHTKGNVATFNPQLANIDLRLYEADGNSLGTLIDESRSTIDNVEHIYETNMTGGHYAIEVTSDQTWDFALAWQTIIGTPPPGDANYDGEVDGLDYLIWASHFGATTATVEQGDFNGDSVVDGLDLIIWTENYTGPISALPGGAPIPEPSSALLAVIGILAWSLRRRRR